MDLGERIRGFRMQRRMSVRQLAEKSGVSPSQTSAIERGRRTSVETIARLARALEVDVSALVEDADLMAERRADYEAGRARDAREQPLPAGLRALVDDPALAPLLDADVVASLATLAPPGDRRLSKVHYLALHLVLREFLQGASDG